tara:strand:+ start:248 stop:1186 length:939 start_codon:yes stop_codon:yes gene_type:complete
MRIFNHLEKTDTSPSSIVTIGNFDGIHLGHRSLIDKVVREANTMGYRSALVTFEPHPQEIINPKKNFSRICTNEHQFHLLEKLGLDEVHIIHFTKELSKMAPEKFALSFLINRFNLTKLVIGYDFRFGKYRSGDIKLLENLSKRFNFSIEEISPIKKKGQTISSTLIRELIKEFNFKDIPAFLGREFSLFGKVVIGKQRGREIGFPTANIIPSNSLAIKNGVYVSKIKLDGKIHYGVTNIGKKPTFGENLLNIETWIFDFEKDIYGKEIEIIPIFQLRAEKKFSKIDDLKKQINKDVKTAQKLLKEKNLITH